MTFKGADTKASSHSSIWTNPAYLWHSGKIIPWDEAKVHITSMSWTAVSAVFEGIRAYWNVEQEELYIFRMDSHMRRLADSMKLMRMLPPYSGQELIDSVIRLLKANQVREDTYIMPFAYFTGSVPGYRAAYQQPSEVFITAVSSSSSLARNSGIHCCISSWVRIADNVMPPRAKGIANYQNSRLVSTEAYLNGYDAGIILNSQGKVAEEGGAFCLCHHPLARNFTLEHKLRGVVQHQGVALWTVTCAIPRCVMVRKKQLVRLHALVVHHPVEPLQVAGVRDRIDRRGDGERRHAPCAGRLPGNHEADDRPVRLADFRAVLHGAVRVVRDLRGDDRWSAERVCRGAARRLLARRDRAIGRQLSLAREPPRAAELQFSVDHGRLPRDGSARRLRREPAVRRAAAPRRAASNDITGTPVEDE